MKPLVTLIKFFDTSCLVTCDRKCTKAWGINKRPRHYFEDRRPGDEDDYEFLSDSEMGKAPEDPGTYEGGQAKPVPPVYIHNKWCVRECERSSLIPFSYKNFSNRHPNMLKRWGICRKEIPFYVENADLREISVGRPHSELYEILANVWDDFAEKNEYGARFAGVSDTLSDVHDALCDVSLLEENGTIKEDLLKRMLYDEK